jgi:hypothetical protein
MLAGIAVSVSDTYLTSSSKCRHIHMLTVYDIPHIWTLSEYRTSFAMAEICLKCFLRSFPSEN